MRFFRPNIAARIIFRKGIFRIPGEGRRLYMTFDDGPTPGVTDRLAEILTEKKVPATFFCTGNKVVNYPSLVESLRNNGFAIANHGMKHLNGYRSSNRDYYDNFLEGKRVTGSRLFRPPYGRITPLQFRMIEKSARVVFWDLMPYDYDWGMPAERVLNVLTRKVRPGSVVVMHDYERSVSPVILDRFIDMCRESGYSFEALTVE